MTGGRAAGLLASLVLMLAACGGGSASSASSGASGAASPTTASGESAGPTGSAVAAGEDLCGLLGPGDFSAVGVGGTSGPTENNDDDSNVYCVFAGTSGATGGIEFDAFLAASPTDAQATYQTMLGELGGDPAAGKAAGAAAFPEADAATIVTTADSAVIAIQQGPLVFDIGIPASDQATAKLTALAALVLERASGLT